MHTIELTLRYSPFPISIQKKEFSEISRIFEEIKSAMKQITPNNLIELECDKITNKKIAVLANEIIAMQIYEKSSIAGGSKRPGFSLDG
tara:strand:+ start:11764 stop:12030 length:267 start_codon:yes stop_codon:yes gene_type:complete